MAQKTIAAIFISLLMTIGLMYVAYIYVNDSFLWIGGLFLFLGTLWNWYLYRKLAIKNKKS